MKHILKIEEKHFFDIIIGAKKSEIRQNDRDFKVGDQIIFQKTNGSKYNLNKEITITHVLSDFPMGLKNNYVIISLEMHP